MKITNKMTDLENANQINYGLRFNDFMRNGEVYLDSYKRDDRSHHWGYFIRKGFDFTFNEFASQGMLKAMIEDEKTGEKSLKDIAEIVNDAYNHNDKGYNLLGFKGSKNLSLEQKEKLECKLIDDFISTSEDLDLNRPGHEFYIRTHAFREAVYVPDGTDNGIDRTELGDQLGIKTFEGVMLDDFTDDIKAKDRQLYDKEPEM